ncbi:S1 family peptidase [Streptomyces olivoreticuli]
MPVRRPRAALVAGLLASTTAASLLTAIPADAVVGPATKDGSYAFTAKLDIGGERSCSGALVESQWLLTAASCFPANPGSSDGASGAPKLKTVATIGRTDLTRDGGSVVKVVELVPAMGSDLLMAKLEYPVTGITPVELGFKTPLPGEDVFVSGYGRTKDEWVPDRLHYAKFSVDAVQNTTVNISSKANDAAVCEGDTGAPTFRDIGGRYELVGINTRSWQGGCFGHEDETRKGAVNARVDNLAGWVQSVASASILPRDDWKNAAYMTSGYFTDHSVANKRRTDLFVAWKDGSASIFQGADHNLPQYPFSAEYKVAAPGSYWKDARAVAAGNFTGSGSDGITVRWANGKLSTYTHVDQNGFHEEKTLGAVGSYWKGARLIAVGRYTDNSLRDDMFVVWDDDSTTLYSDLGTNGIGKQSQLEKGWAGAMQISSGEFNGDGTADLLVRWSDGSATLFSALSPTGYRDRTRIRPLNSAWKNVQNLTVGSFSGEDGTPSSEVLIRWAAGPLSYYPGVSTAGTTRPEVQLVG